MRQVTVYPKEEHETTPCSSPRSGGTKPTSRSRKTSSSRLLQPSLAMASRIPSMLGWLRHGPSSASVFRYFLFRLTMDSLQGNIQGSGKRLHACTLSVPLCPTRHILEGLAVVDDGNHVLHITVWVLPVSQVLFFVKLGFLFVSESTQGNPKLSPGTGDIMLVRELRSPLLDQGSL